MHRHILEKINGKERTAKIDGTILTVNWCFRIVIQVSQVH